MHRQLRGATEVNKMDGEVGFKFPASQQCDVSAAVDQHCCGHCVCGVTYCGLCSTTTKVGVPEETENKSSYRT